MVVSKDDILKALNALGVGGDAGVLADVQKMNDEAKQAGIATKTVAETPAPAPEAPVVDVNAVVAAEVQKALGEIKPALDAIVAIADRVKKLEESSAQFDARNARIDKTMTEIKGYLTANTKVGDGVETVTGEEAKKAEAQVEKTAAAVQNGLKNLKFSPAGTPIFPRG